MYFNAYSLLKPSKTDLWKLICFVRMWGVYPWTLNRHQKWTSYPQVHCWHESAVITLADKSEAGKSSTRSQCQSYRPCPLPVLNFHDFRLIFSYDFSGFFGMRFTVLAISCLSLVVMFKAWWISHQGECDAGNEWCNNSNNLFPQLQAALWLVVFSNGGNIC